MSGGYVPQRGERVLAVLPDRHEIENGYWLCEDGTGRYWLALLADFGPVRVGNADPWSES